jgi:hypothetical protein
LPEHGQVLGEVASLWSTIFTPTLSSEATLNLLVLFACLIIRTFLFSRNNVFLS